MADKKAWGPAFHIYDEDNNLIHSEYYDTDNGWGQYKTGDGGGIFARTVSPYKVEIYHVRTCQASVGFTAMYTMTIPEPEAPVAPLYITGAFNGWDPANPDTFTYADGKYTYELALEKDGFKISTAKGDWSTFNALSLIHI